jgi:hypothetical protein
MRSGFGRSADDNCGILPAILELDARSKRNQRVLVSFEIGNSQQRTIGVKNAPQQAILKRADYNESATKYDGEENQQIVSPTLQHANWAHYFDYVPLLILPCYFGGFFLIIISGDRRWLLVCGVCLAEGICLASLLYVLACWFWGW